MMTPLTLLAVLLAQSAPTAVEAPWKLIEEDGTLKIWNRDVSGSSIRELRAEMIMGASADRVWDVLADVDHYPEFMPYVVETKIVSRHAEGHYEYQRLDPPLVDGRDYTVKVTVKKEALRYQRLWTSANDMGPKLQEDVVRVPVNQGAWTIDKLGPDKAKLTYHLYTDPGGIIPAWIANKANTTSIPDLLNSIDKRARDPGWKR